MGHPRLYHTREEKAAARRLNSQKYYEKYIQFFVYTSGVTNYMLDQEPCPHLHSRASSIQEKGSGNQKGTTQGANR